MVFFSILEISNFLEFQNFFPKLHEPSWFWFLFVFSWNSLFFVCLITRDPGFAKNWCRTKCFFFLIWTSLRDFYRFLCSKTIFFIFFIFCFPIDTSMKLFITWFSKIFYLFPDWYIHETHFACNKELRHRDVKKGYRQKGLGSKGGITLLFFFIVHSSRILGDYGHPRVTIGGWLF